MNNKRMYGAMDLRLEEAEKERLWQEILRKAEKDDPPEQEEKPMKKKSIKAIMRVTLLAAVLTVLFTVTAYATDVLGMRAVMIPQEAATESAEPSANAQPEGALVSITQPQAVPEELSPEIAAKVENARKAWQEWQEWKQNSPDLPHEPEVFRLPDGMGSAASSYEENEDGTVTIKFYSADQMIPENGELVPVETRVATAEEMRAEEAYMEYQRSSYGDYDFNYDVHTAAEADQLEAIAAKYGLRLRRGTSLLWSKETVEESDAEWNALRGTNLHTDTSDPRFLTNAQLCERVSEIGCHGELFTQIPRGFDKVYYFDEGTFAVSWFAELPSTGERVHCYGYNSVYSTLSSGREVVSHIREPQSFSVRTHTAPDGTELTILQNGEQVFLYAYLDNSFFEEEIHGTADMSDADVDYLADYLIYSNIGR